jgi:thioesterase domain-containing protein
MAADRLPLILERQASGPFLVGGKCNGAMVAFETARPLMAAGHKVDRVVMVDPPTVSARPAPRAILGLMQSIASPYRLRWTYELMTRLERYFEGSRSQRIAKLYDALSNPDRASDPSHGVRPALWAAYSIAMAQYLPAPLEVPVSFYAADHDGRAWRRLTSQLEVIQVPGGHRDCLTTGAELLVDHLRLTIDVLNEAAPPISLTTGLIGM